MMTTRITTIEETYLRLKTERMVVISDILAWRDGRTDIRTDGRTDTASYRDAMDASKNVRMYLRHSRNVIVDLWYCFH